MDRSGADAAAGSSGSAARNRPVGRNSEEKFSHGNQSMAPWMDGGASMSDDLVGRWSRPFLLSLFYVCVCVCPSFLSSTSFFIRLPLRFAFFVPVPARAYVADLSHPSTIWRHSLSSNLRLFYSNYSCPFDFGSVAGDTYHIKHDRIVDIPQVSLVFSSNYIKRGSFLFKDYFDRLPYLYFELTVALVCWWPERLRSIFMRQSSRGYGIPEAISPDDSLFYGRVPHCCNLRKLPNISPTNPLLLPQDK